MNNLLERKTINQLDELRNKIDDMSKEEWLKALNNIRENAGIQNDGELPDNELYNMLMRDKNGTTK